MDFTIEERKHPNIRNYTTADYKLADKFANAMKTELGEFLKSAILFGSSARREKPIYERDIDVLMLVDDLTLVLSPEVVEAYRVITERTASKVSKRLHVTTMKLTNFWEYVRNGDPLAVNMLRDGVPLLDTGIFEPLQMLLFQGRIRPTRESMYVYFARAPATLVNADWHVMQAVLDLYWAVIDAAHAALIRVGEIPPSPSHMADMVYEKLYKKKLVSKKAPKTMEFFYRLSRKITHREIQRIAGKEYDAYKAEAEAFVKEMKKVVEAR
jgi:predicted nucleotidyltransferase